MLKREEVIMTLLECDPLYNKITNKDILEWFQHNNALGVMNINDGTGDYSGEIEVRDDHYKLFINHYGRHEMDLICHFSPGGIVTQWLAETQLGMTHCKRSKKWALRKVLEYQIDRLLKY